MATMMRFSLPRIRRDEEFRAEVQRTLDRESREYLAQVSDNIKENIGMNSGRFAAKRKAESTGRLARVTRDPGNRYLYTAHWRAPNTPHLNRSEAKYWRLIEQGSAGLYANRRGFIGTPLMFNPSGFSGGRDFRGLKKRIQDDNARAKYYSRRPGRGRGVKVITVTKEITAMNMYRKTFYQHNWPDRIRRDFAQTVSRYL